MELLQWVHASPEFTAAMTRVCMDVERVDQCDEGIGHLVAMTVPPPPKCLGRRGAR